MEACFTEVSESDMFPVQACLKAVDYVKEHFPTGEAIIPTNLQIFLSRTATDSNMRV